MNTPGILNDKQIARLCLEKDMITPWFCDSINRSEVTGDRVLSYGMSSFGYDIRAERKFKVFHNVNTTSEAKILDPLNFDPNNYTLVEGDSCIIPPNSFILTHTPEYFKMPPDVIGIVLTKSTLARVGTMCLATPLEPGWEGHLTLEFANTTPCPVRFHAMMGCAQILFFRGERPEVSYADRGGKYQGQGNEAVDPKV